LRAYSCFDAIGFDMRGEVMEFGAFPEKQWSALRDIDGVAHSIRKRCERIIALLAEAASIRSILGDGAVKITPAGDNQLAGVRTPVGNGRVVLSWEVVDGNLLGIMSFERERHDNYDRQYWEPVWGLRVPQYDNPYYGAKDAPVSIPVDQPYGQSRSNAAFTALMSMLFGLINGPVRP
jgi:hypothetical protein